MSDEQSSDASATIAKNGRRTFIRDSGLMIAGGAIGTAVAASRAVHAGADDSVRVAFVGCGRRARHLADAVLAAGGPSTKIVALADLFHDQTQAMYRSLKGRFGNQVASDCLRASGSDSYESAMQSNADIVYLTTPPCFRPQHFRAAVDAGKHVFLEKPLAADVAGIAEMLDVAEQASQSGLSVHVGFQRRYSQRYREVISKIQDGEIGLPLFARAFCNGGPLRRLTQSKKTSDGDRGREFQIRNWNHYQWTGGDFLLEQHVAGLDVVRWALGRTPVVAQGQGGWGDLQDSLAASSDRTGEVFDHHSVEFEFEDGIHLMSQCRRVAKAWNNTSEHLHGTLGRADLSRATLYSHDGSVMWESKASREPGDGTQSQAAEILRSIRGGLLVNEMESAAESTLLALLGHEASLTGKRTRWDKLLRRLA